MKKLALVLDDLRVNTFVTSQTRVAPRGTVHANFYTNDTETGCTQSICGQYAYYTEWPGCGGDSGGSGS